jgi:hypothetical protein
MIAKIHDSIIIQLSIRRHAVLICSRNSLADECIGKPATRLQRRLVGGVKEHVILIDVTLVA